MSGYDTGGGCGRQGGGREPPECNQHANTLRRRLYLRDQGVRITTLLGQPLPVILDIMRHDPVIELRVELQPLGPLSRSLALSIALPTGYFVSLGLPLLHVNV